MQIQEIIPGYNSSILPKSRYEVSSYLKSIIGQKNNLSRTDREILSDLEVEFEYDLYSSTKKNTSLLNKPLFKNLFSNNYQKHLYFYTDSLASFFFGGFGYISYRGSKGDSLGDRNILLGLAGLKARGTLLNTFGYSISASNGKKLRGDRQDEIFVRETDPVFRSYNKFGDDDSGNFYDDYRGYLRYASKYELVSVTAGREYLKEGFGYSDQLFLSSNSPPFSFINIGLNYKALQYSFIYGSLKGDSLGRDIRYKSIISHRLNINFSERVKAGFFEALIVSDNAFNFTYLNPLSFIRSADYKTGTGQSALNNALIGMDIEVQPLKNVSFQSSLLIDDLNFGTLFTGEKDGKVRVDNRFAWQVGSMWSNAFTVPAMTLVLEYTRINPFVYTHRTNKSSYANWGLPLGHGLPPNSDEIFAGIKYNITSRLTLDLNYNFQRSASGFIIRNGKFVNYGGDLNRGDGDTEQKPVFLEGYRVNRNIINTHLIWEPLRQLYLDAVFVYRITNNIYENRKLEDKYWFLTFRLDY